MAVAVNKTITPQTYTTAQITTILSNLTCSIKTVGDAIYKARRYGTEIPCEYPTLQRMYVMCYWTIAQWNQSAGGNTYGQTNNLTQTQLTAAITWAKINCIC